MIKKLILNWLLGNEDDLVKHKAYRKLRGGFWCYSAVMGWSQEICGNADVRLQHSLDEPELYSYGKDIEDYRSNHEH